MICDIDTLKFLADEAIDTQKVLADKRDLKRHLFELELKSLELQLLYPALCQVKEVSNG